MTPVILPYILKHNQCGDGGNRGITSLRTVIVINIYTIIQKGDMHFLITESGYALF